MQSNTPFCTELAADGDIQSAVFLRRYVYFFVCMTNIRIHAILKASSMTENKTD